MYARRIRERIEEGYIPEPNSGCWLWLGGCLVNGGYGYLYDGTLQLRAHRVSYELFCGPIPEGYLIRHKCDVSCCINPQHLLIGTDWDNNQDKMIRGRHVGFGKGSANPNTSLTVDDVRQIRALAGTMSQQSIADIYGITQATAGKIINRVTWQHVD